MSEEPVSPIVRTCTAQVLPGQLAAFTSYLLATVRQFPQQHPGLLSHEVLVNDDADELLYLSRWRDERALVKFAGPGWREDPLVSPGETAYLRGPLKVRHYREMPTSMSPLCD